MVKSIANPTENQVQLPDNKYSFIKSNILSHLDLTKIYFSKGEGDGLDQLN